MIAGVEPMSEPRNKNVPQSAVVHFYEGVCGAVHAVDDRMPCVVGPTPYYKVWQLNSSMLLHGADGKLMSRECRALSSSGFAPCRCTVSHRRGGCRRKCHRGCRRVRYH